MRVSVLFSISEGADEAPAILPVLFKRSSEYLEVFYPVLKAQAAMVSSGNWVLIDASCRILVHAISAAYVCQHLRCVVTYVSQWYDHALRIMQRHSTHTVRL
jgi:hypothetical protein